MSYQSEPQQSRYLEADCRYQAVLQLQMLILRRQKIRWQIATVLMSICLLAIALSV